MIHDIMISSDKKVYFVDDSIKEMWKDLLLLQVSNWQLVEPNSSMLNQLSASSKWPALQIKEWRIQWNSGLTMIESLLQRGSQSYN